MRIEGKEILIFSLLIVAGTIAGISVSSISSNIYLIGALSTVFLAATILCIIPPKRPVFLICSAFLFCGAFSGTAHHIFPDLPTPEPSGITSQASAYLKTSIDSIPFTDTQAPALIKAMITGDRSQLSPSLRNAFQKSGASHLLALSGMHIGVIYVLITSILSFIGHSPISSRIRSTAIIVITGFYTIMTGAGASVTRAFLFIALKEAGRCFGRKTDLLTLFSASLAIQLSISPLSISNAGFQLSYLAMAGIIILHPKIRIWYDALPGGQEHSLIKKIWNLISITISCQVFTAPAAWLHFGTFPTYFLISNLISIPLTSLIINLSILTLITDIIFEAPDILVRLTDTLIKALLFTMETISSI